MAAQIIVMSSATPPCHLDRVEDHLGAHVRCAPPADDHWREHIDDEADIGHACPCRHERQVHDQEPVRSGRGELPIDQVRVPRGCWIGPGRLDPFASCRPAEPDGAHESARLVPADVKPGTTGGLPELADPIDAIVRLPQRHQFRRHDRVVHGAR